jgi:hypothetical protein
MTAFPMSHTRRSCAWEHVQAKNGIACGNREAAESKEEDQTGGNRGVENEAPLSLKQTYG